MEVNVTVMDEGSVSTHFRNSKRNRNTTTVIKKENMVNLLLLKHTFILCLIMILSAGGCKSKHPENMDLSTIKELDLERYMGKWYDIARFDHSFERNLTGVSATYNLRPDGRITVINHFKFQLIINQFYIKKYFFI